MRRVWPMLMWLIALIGACGADQVVTPARNLDRPVAAAFVCMKTDTANEPFEPAPLGECTGSPKGRKLHIFVANSTRGEVAVVDADTERLQDLAPSLPGYQFATVGGLPSDIAASTDGCQVVTANRGSCDFTLIDTLALLSSEPGVPSTWRTEPQWNGKALRARPQSLMLRGPAADSCPKIGSGAGYQAYVTFPACGLVARIDLESGEVLEALRISNDGMERVSSLECPDECGAGGLAASDSALPSAIDMTSDQSLLVVGGEGAPFVAWIALDAESGQFLSFGRISLEGEIGVRRVEITPTTDVGPFVYAVASDGTVRVVSIDAGRECETQVDPRALPEVVDPELALCFPVGDANLPRRTLARSPGISLGDDLPIDVSSGNIRCCPEAADGSECPDTPERTICIDYPLEGDALSALYYDGMYAFVASSQGLIYVVDIQDDFQSARTSEGFRREALPHSIRPVAARADRDCAEPTDAVMDYRWPQPTISSMSLNFGTQSIENTDETVPGLLDATPCPYTCEVAEDVCVDVCGSSCAGEDDFGIRFADPRVVEAETIELAFEGAIPGSGRQNGFVEPCESDVCLRDPGAAFCGMGVEAGDILTLRGCTSDNDCDATSEVCGFDPGIPTGIDGFCVPQAASEERLNDCRRLVRSRREYRVNEARQDRLRLEILPVPLHCEPEEPCPPCHDTLETNDCIRSCKGDDDCVGGSVCERVDGERVCVAAPELEPGCFAASTRYLLRTGNAFRIVFGQDEEFFHRVVPDEEGLCVLDGDKSALRSSRISLQPPPCVSTDPPNPNPCVEESRSLERYIYHADPRYNFALRRAQWTPVRTPESTFVMRFAVVNPLEPLATATGAFQSARILGGPNGYQYLVDVGDTVPAGGVRGQLLRWSPLTAAVDTSFVVR